MMLIPGEFSVLEESLSAQIINFGPWESLILTKDSEKLKKNKSSAIHFK